MKILRSKFYPGFDAAISIRIVPVILYASFACGSIVWLENRTMSVQPLPAKTAQEGIISGILNLESSFDVSEWKVSVNTVVMTSKIDSSSHWDGQVQLNREGGAEILIEAMSGEQFADHGHALKLTFEINNNKINKIYWGHGDIVEQFRLSEDDLRESLSPGP
jgi:hypothetical protein